MNIGHKRCAVPSTKCLDGRIGQSSLSSSGRRTTSKLCPEKTVWSNPRTSSAEHTSDTNLDLVNGDFDRVMKNEPTQSPLVTIYATTAVTGHRLFGRLPTKTSTLLCWTDRISTHANELSPLMGYWVCPPKHPLNECNGTWLLTLQRMGGVHLHEKNPAKHRAATAVPYVASFPTTL